MRWHEMAIDQAELEHKVSNFQKDVSKVERLFEESLRLERKVRNIAKGVWPMTWLGEKLIRRWQRTSHEEILKVLAQNEELFNWMDMTRMKLDTNDEDMSENDKKAEISLRQSIDTTQVLLNEVESKFVQFDGFLTSRTNSAVDSEGSNRSQRSSSRSSRRFFRFST